MILSEEGKAGKSCEEMRQDQQRVLRGSERSICVCVLGWGLAGAAINADRRQRGLSYFNIPSPHFVSPADLAAQPKSLIVSPGGSSASIAANNSLLRSDSVASWPSDQRMSHSRCVCCHVSWVVCCYAAFQCVINREASRGSQEVHKNMFLEASEVRNKPYNYAFLMHILSPLPHFLLISFD